MDWTGYAKHGFVNENKYFVILFLEEILISLGKSGVYTNLVPRAFPFEIEAGGKGKSPGNEVGAYTIG